MMVACTKVIAVGTDTCGQIQKQSNKKQGRSAHGNQSLGGTRSEVSRLGVNESKDQTGNVDNSFHSIAVKGKREKQVTDGVGWT